MRIRAKDFAGQLDISSPEVLGDSLTKVFRRSMVVGDVLEVPDEFYQFPNIKNAIDLGFLEILSFDLSPESYVISAELDAVLAGLPMETAIKERITQPGHGFVAGNVVFIAPSGDFALAQANDFDTADPTVGVIESIPVLDEFIVVYGGAITGLSGLVAGTVYFLSETTAGMLVAGEPTCPTVSKPMLVAKSATEGVVVNHRGLKPGDGNESKRWMGL